MGQQVYYKNPAMQVTRKIIWYGDPKPVYSCELAPATDGAEYEPGYVLARYSDTAPEELRGKCVNWVEFGDNGQGDPIGFLANEDYSPRDFTIKEYPVEYYIGEKQSAALLVDKLVATPGSPIQSAFTALNAVINELADGTKILNF